MSNPGTRPPLFRLVAHVGGAAVDALVTEEEERQIASALQAGLVVQLYQPRARGGVDIVTIAGDAPAIVTVRPASPIPFNAAGLPAQPGEPVASVARPDDVDAYARANHGRAVVRILRRATLGDLVARLDAVIAAAAAPATDHHNGVKPAGKTDKGGEA